MRVLLTCKTTSFALNGTALATKTAQGHLSPAHLERLRLDSDAHQQTLDLLRQELSQRGVSFVEIERGQPWPQFEASDLVMTVGGDGTVLEASHHIGAQAPPIIGIRSSPLSVGFLCAGSKSEIPAILDSIIKGSLTYLNVARMQLEVKHSDGMVSKSIPILNDVLYAHSNPAATSRYQITLGDRCEVQKSSGVWLATPAGSTAAIYAAGGIVQDLQQTKFQYKVREPFYPPGTQPGNLLGGVLATDASLEIENRTQEAMLGLDGHHNLVSLGFGDITKFQSGPVLRLAKPQESH